MAAALEQAALFYPKRGMPIADIPSGKFAPYPCRVVDVIKGDKTYVTVLARNPAERPIQPWVVESVLFVDVGQKAPAFGDFVAPEDWVPDYEDIPAATAQPPIHSPHWWNRATNVKTPAADAWNDGLA